jgi:hypothetical protein
MSDSHRFWGLHTPEIRRAVWLENGQVFDFDEKGNDREIARPGDV